MSDEPANKRIDGWWYWWPLLIGPAAMALVYLAEANQWSWLLTKRYQEWAAPVLTALAMAGFGVRYFAGRAPIHLILAALAVAFFCREWHFVGTGTGIYVALVVIGVWALLWRRRLLPSLHDGQFRFWLIATLATYLLSQLVARRVFRFLPNEHPLHVPLEEIVENAAHLMLVITSLTGLGRGGDRAKKEKI